MRLRSAAHLLLLIAMLIAVAAGMAGFTHLGAAEPVAAEGAPAAITVSIDWFAEIAKGGMTAAVQILLVVAATAFAIERFLHVRRRHVVPEGLTAEVKTLWDRGDHEGILRRCEERPSIQSRIVAHLVRHRHADYQTLMQGAGDIGARDLKVHSQKTYPLAVVATLEPLLGLLGTMIGMIEAFAKVAAFGDTGDAAMLADAIGKALITTALGLIIAIPVLALYHWFKQRTSLLGTELEEEIEELATSWFIAAGGEKASLRAVPVASVAAHAGEPTPVGLSATPVSGV